MTNTDLHRRAMLASTAAATGAAMLTPSTASAAARSSDLAAIRKALEAGKAESVTRLQEWIRHPGIAAEKWRVDESCEFTMGLLREAGFQKVKKMRRTAALESSRPSTPEPSAASASTSCMT